MAAPAFHAVPALKDVEAAISGTSTDKRLKMLLGLTDLFITSQEGYSAEQIRVFDDLLIHVTKQIESEALIELSIRLAPQPKAPPNTLRRLAAHDSIGIAGPVLINSGQLTDKDLVEIAKTKSQAHLAMIARRQSIAEPVTEALVDHGDSDVLNEVASNAGARFSESTMGKLVFCADRDDRLTLSIFRRADVPPVLVHQLVRQATDSVRAKLMKSARPDQVAVLEGVIRDIAGRMSGGPKPDYAVAAKRVATFSQDTSETKSKLYEFASTGRVAETVAILSVLSAVEIESVAPLVENSNSLALVIVCRALALPWRTARAVLALCAMGPTPPPHARERGYNDMTPASAQRILRFWHGRQTVRRQSAVSRR